MLGQQMTLVAVPFQVYALTGVVALVGVTSIVALVPLIVFGLLGRRHRRRHGPPAADASSPRSARR